MRVGKILVTLLLIAATGNSFSQNYRFKWYTTKEGLPQNFINDIAQDDNGFLWVATGAGLARLDGVNMRSYTTTQGLAEDFCAFVYNYKNSIFVGHNQGGLSVLQDNKPFVLLPDSAAPSAIVGFTRDSLGNVWAASQNGFVIRINKDMDILPVQFADEDIIFNCINTAPNGDLLIGTSNGLVQWPIDAKSKLPGRPQRFKEIPEYDIAWVATGTGKEVFVSTKEQGTYHLADEGGELVSQSNLHELTVYSGVRHARITKDRVLWLSTYAGLERVVVTEEGSVNGTLRYSKANGLFDYTTVSFDDREGNLWVGTVGEGLAVLMDEFFTFYSHNNTQFSNATWSIFFKDEIKWFGVNNGLARLDPGLEERWKFYNQENGFVADRVNGISQDLLGRLWLATENSGLWVMDIANEKFTQFELSEDALSLAINLTVFDGRYIWAATQGGLYRIDQESMEIKLFDTSSGMVHNNIHAIAKERSGSIWAGTHGNQLINIKRDDIVYEELADFNQLMDINAIDFSDDGTIWVATYGHGIFKVGADSVEQFTVNDGLQNNYCYSIIAGNQGDVWVGHRGGVSRYFTGSGTFELFGPRNGIDGDCTSNGTYRDGKDNIWIGTTKGVVRFDPTKYSQNATPPLMNLLSLKIGEEEVDFTKTIELDYDAYKFVFDYIGISLKDPEGVVYQVYLEGHDLDWSEPNERTDVTYPRIEDGEYTFYVKACNNSGACSEPTALVRITVDAPFWKKLWFIILVSIALIGIIVLIVRVREKNQRALQLYLENQLDARTKEVVDQKEELERKNKDITDSINYALRIQQAILPGDSALKTALPESFIFYRPRDIVSGDFYWYQLIDHHFVIACADCTGHGVPGGFMSMISSTIFKDIATQRKETDPGRFLELVDSSVRSTLQQDTTATTHDGLDAALCSLNLLTGEMQFSGAVRPLIIMGEDGLKQIKGSSDSIGGSAIGDEKVFETVDVELKPGDTVYMFTDGFPDQFGEQTGKKLKLSGVKKLIEELAEVPLSQQEEKISIFFDEWQGEEPQIDDVLMIAFKYQGA